MSAETNEIRIDCPDKRLRIYGRKSRMGTDWAVELGDRSFFFRRTAVRKITRRVSQRRRSREPTSLQAVSIS